MEEVVSYNLNPNSEEDMQWAMDYFQWYLKYIK